MEPAQLDQQARDLRPGGVRGEWGLPPTAIVDMLALMGDSSDNVPGVPKIGKKTAVDLLTQFGSIEGIYQRRGGEEALDQEDA